MRQDSEAEDLKEEQTSQEGLRLRIFNQSSV